MAIFNARLTGINRAELLRYAGLTKKPNYFPESLLSEACNQGHILSQPKGCWQNYDYDAATGMILADSPLKLTGASICSHLASATAVAILAVTIGPALEQQVTQNFSNGEYTAGLLLDAAGTVAVESAADQLNKLITRQAAGQGLTTLRRFSPGYGDWNITVQPYILSLAQQQTIGITTTERCMLLPRKSVTAIIGLKPADETHLLSCYTSDNNCSNCNKTNCFARKEFTER
ncbi:MAG: methionine synthase [Veillonellales bacterium]